LPSLPTPPKKQKGPNFIEFYENGRREERHTYGNLGKPANTPRSVRRVTAERSSFEIGSEFAIADLQREAWIPAGI
jgi:hypothetical protein